MIIDFDRPVGEIVRQDYRTADVFKKWQLNFCCGGEIALKSLCESKQLDFDRVVYELQEATRDMKISSQIHFQDWKIDFLIDFITRVHHDYIYQVLPPLKTALEAFALTHTHKFPELVNLVELVDKLSNKLIVHNKHEDEIIFPYIRQMYSAYKRNEAYGNLFVRTLRKPLNTVEKDQREISELLSSLSRITSDFQAPAKVCSTYEVLLSKLKELHENLLQHQYLERDILFPKAIEIEQKLLQ
jgi:regulator of cell morphogenesis and NO signaling